MYTDRIFEGFYISPVTDEQAASPLGRSREFTWERPEAQDCDHEVDDVAALTAAGTAVGFCQHCNRLLPAARWGSTRGGRESGARSSHRHLRLIEGGAQEDEDADEF